MFTILLHFKISSFDIYFQRVNCSDVKDVRNINSIINDALLTFLAHTGRHIVFGNKMRVVQEFVHLRTSPSTIVSTINSDYIRCQCSRCAYENHNTFVSLSSNSCYVYILEEPVSNDFQTHRIRFRYGDICVLYLFNMSTHSMYVFFIYFFSFFPHSTNRVALEFCTGPLGVTLGMCPHKHAQDLYFSLALIRTEFRNILQKSLLIAYRGDRTRESLACCILGD